MYISIEKKLIAITWIFELDKNKPHSGACSVNAEADHRCEDASDNRDAVDDEDDSVHDSLAH